jgi:hypothetical protein
VFSLEEDMHHVFVVMRGHFDVIVAKSLGVGKALVAERVVLVGDDDRLLESRHVVAYALHHDRALSDLRLSRRVVGPA